MKKISPVVIVGLILTAGSFGLYVSGSAFVQDVSNKAYDAFLRQVRQHPQSGRVTVVDIDEQSLKEIGQWPWPRYIVADLTRKILAAGASVVAFDIVFAEKDRTSPMVIERDMKRYLGLDVDFARVPERMRDFDRMFADVLKDGKVIIGCFMRPAKELKQEVDYSVDPYFRTYLQLLGKSGNINDFIMQADGLTISIPELNEAANTAFYNASPDGDGIVRGNPLIWAFGPDRQYPSLSLEAVRMDRGADKCIVRFNENGVQEIRVPPGRISGGNELRIPVDQAGRLKVNYRTYEKDAQTGFVCSFPVLRAADILSGKVAKPALEDKIVFIGTSAVGLRDIKATPLTQFFSGVEIHATMVDNILAGDMLWEPTWMVLVHAASIVFVGVFLTVFIARGRSWLSFLVSVVVILAAVKASMMLMERYHLVFVPAWMMLAVILIYPVLTMIKFWQEELQKKQVRSMFGTMVSEDVLQYLESNPGSFSLSGQKAEATMFFSDVGGFTSISESLRPEEVSELLNRYLSPMTRIIMNRRGYVDKYEGDLIMAEWGVPFPMPDHGVQACMAALEQQRELAQLRPWLKKAFGHEIHVRMGLNSGMVTAGNMGSDRRFEFTVMGDAVNLAARLEPANRHYGTTVIIGENTYEAAKDAIEARLLDKVVVRGKSLPVRIYELLACKGEMPDDRLECVRLYEQALELHWARRWSEAMDAIDKALELDPGDSPCSRMRARVAVYMDDPPPESWQGEYVWSAKG